MEGTATVAPEQLLQLVGHPLRWQLLTELGRSDRRVHELTALVGEPQNLVSYHLGKLRAAELVSARRSSADRRDTYYTADLWRVGSLLAGAGVALHPGLRYVPSASGPPPPRRRVLFLCTGNSARSQMAEALAIRRSRGRIDARSAGSHPKPLHPAAVRVLAEDHGIDIAGHPTTHLQAVAGERFDRVVTLCDRVREVCPELPGHPEHVHWSIPDPAADADPADDEAALQVFRAVAADIDVRVGFLLAALATDHQPATTEEHP